MFYDLVVYIVTLGEIMQAKPTKLYFKGARRYVHGTTIFQAMLEYMEAYLPEFKEKQHPLTIKNFKIVRELQNQAFLRLMGPQDGDPEPVAIMDFVYGDTSSRLALIEDASSPVLESRSGREKILVPHDPNLTGDFAGNGTIKGAKDIYSLLEGLIEANKRLHIITLKQKEQAPQVRWTYLQNCTIDPSWNLKGQDLQVEIVHKGARSMGNRTYTLNRVIVNDLYPKLETVLCFSYF